MNSSQTDPLTGRPKPVFFHYAIPSVAGLLALSSASIVNAIFMGNYVGTAALAAVNLTMPAVSLLLAIAWLLAIGGSVLTGKLLGEGRPDAASDIFSKIMILALGITTLLSVPCLIFVEQLVGMLGANEELFPLVSDYLKIVLLAAPVTTVAYTLYYFVMVDGQPVLACNSLIAGSAINIGLNYLFVVHMGLGVPGSATATALSHCAILLILSAHLFSRHAQLRLRKPAGSWKPLGRASLNGASEFTNELSVGIVTLLFNWTLISRFGTDGVAAFTVVEYVMFIGIMLAYGFADALQPLISKNLGARQADRIYQFLRVGMISALCISVVMSVLLLTVPELLIGIFLQDEALSTMEIAMLFAQYFWPAPLFIGANIILTVFFTATDQPLPSAIIALSRSLVLPALFLLSLPLLLGDLGVYITLPMAELITLLLALWLFRSRPVIRFD